MPTFMKVLGWLLLVPGVILLLMSPVPLCEANSSATAGLIMLGLFFGGPGGLLLRGGIKRQRETELQEQMAGFVRANEAFTINELAAHIGKPPAVAQNMLTRDIARYQLPLVMHRASGRYMRLDRLTRAAQVAERCQSCGASIGTQIVLEGERLNCPYCGVVVQTHAASQAPVSQPAPGSWAQAPAQPAAATPWQAQPQQQQPWQAGAPYPQVAPPPQVAPQPHVAPPHGNPPAQSGWPQQGGPWGHG